MWKWSSALICATALAAGSAYAQSVSLAGVWELRAVNAPIDCIITGEATLSPGASANSYTVRMVTTETCSGFAYEPVEQECAALRRGDDMEVRCRVTEIDPHRAYLPDDFLLTMNGPDEMVGLLTANWNAPAIWRRGQSRAPIS